MRLTLVISSLDSGGAERVMSILASHWSSIGHEVTLVTTDPSVPDFYEVSPRVDRIRLPRKPVTRGIGRQVERVKSMIRLRSALAALHPDVVVSFMDVTNILTLLATTGMKIPVVVSERTEPRAHQLTTLHYALRRAMYWRASALVVQTRSVADWARSLIATEKLHVIANPVVLPDQVDQAGIPIPYKPFVLAVGRLQWEKGFDILIEAFSLCSKTLGHWNLVIYGKGSEEPQLKEQARSLGAGSRVYFPGTTDNLAPVYRNASLFVLSSRYEGFPNALVEAMAVGLPVIAANCRSGPGEIISNEVNGLLVDPEDVEQLRNAMERLMNDRETADRLGDQASAVAERFSLPKIGQDWERVFSSVTATSMRAAR